jgi:hypothetical protein
MSLEARIIALAQSIGADIKALISGKVDKSGAVTSVAGKTGAVTLAKGDVGLGNADNTSDAVKPVSAPQQAALDLKANLAGATFTGDISVIKTAGAVLFGMDSQVGAARNHRFMTAGLDRWRFGANNAAESGSNLGSDFAVARYNDAGTYVDNPISISRATGQVAIGSLGVNNGAQVTGNLTVSSPSSTPFLIMDAPSGNQKITNLRSGGLERWRYGCTSVAESGSNAGSDFFIARYADAGTGISTPLSISRSTGETAIAILSVNGPLRPAQYTLTTLPSATAYNGYEIDVTNATGGSKRCRSNGTVWQILNTTTTVS